MYTSKTPITLDELGRLAPSALAVAPHESRSSRYGRRIRTREVKSIGADIKLNQAIWALSTKMAELKTA